jgi:hypothetical protein
LAEIDDSSDGQKSDKSDNFQNSSSKSNRGTFFIRTMCTNAILWPNWKEEIGGGQLATFVNKFKPSALRFHIPDLSKVADLSDVNDLIAANDLSDVNDLSDLSDLSDVTELIINY